MHLYIMPCLQQNLQKEIHLLSQEEMDSDHFPEALVSVKPSSAEACNGLEETLLNWIWNESVAVDSYCSRNCLIWSKFFIAI